MKNAAFFLFALCATPLLSQVEPIMHSTTVAKGSEAVLISQGVNNTQLAYIDQYKHIAISEMERSGIPASITLAQGILESNAGQSELARNANNHFGIKCGGGWNGKSVTKIDDEFNPDGSRKESCFRQYKDADESFTDHSEFLRDPRKSTRYGYLFNLEPTDYKAWAKGLQAAGYATSPTYADNLIGLIERYSLYEHDRASSSPVFTEPPVAKDKDKDKNNPQETKPGKEIKQEKYTANEMEALRRIGRINDVKVVLAQDGESLKDIARMYDIKAENLVSYNDRGYTSGQILKKNDRIYIQPKRPRWRGKATDHFVRDNQSMFEIAQLYGVKLDKLYKMNRMQPGTQAANDERINLKRRRPVDDNVKLRSGRSTDVRPDPTPAGTEPVKMTPDDDLLFEPDGNKPKTDPVPESTPRPATTGVQRPIDPEPAVVIQPGYTPTTPTNTQPAYIPGAKYHTVVKGDTLYNLSKRYNTTTAKIKQLNNLPDDSIQLGASLRVQ